MSRYLYYYTHIGGPYPIAAARFCQEPDRWLPAPASQQPSGWHVDLVAEGALPGPLARRRALVTIQPPEQAPGHLLRRVAWRATTADRWFPVLEADLELTQLAGSGSHLSLMGSYQPPLGVIGNGGDRLAGHSIAEACARRFVLDIADRLTAPSPASNHRCASIG
jgi:hypothetical protein